MLTVCKNKSYGNTQQNNVCTEQMRNSLNKTILTLLLALTSLILLNRPLQGQVGHILEGIGPIANGMGTAVTGNPQDPCGSAYWNPAGFATMPSSMISGGMEIMMPNTHLTSSLRPNSFGPGMPPAGMSGRTKSRKTMEFIPGLALVYKPKDPAARWTIGVGMYGISGFGTDYPKSKTNPILTPQAPKGMGFGRIYSSMAIAQVCPTFAYKMTDKWLVGASVIYDFAQLNVDPFPGARPDDANGDGFPSYPNVYKDTANGAGFQLATLYRCDSGLKFGFSFKSTQWFEKFQFNARDEMHHQRSFSYHIDYPMIVSGGIGYSHKKFDADIDLRYYDYSGTAGFDDTGFDSHGAVKGFGWDSIWEVATGIQYHVTKRLILRTGYIYNQNPIPDKYTFFNVASPAIIQHHVSCGLSYMLTDNWMVAASYTHGFKNSITGHYIGPKGPVKGTSVKSAMSTDIVILGMGYFF